MTETIRVSRRGAVLDVVLLRNEAAGWLTAPQRAALLQVLTHPAEGAHAVLLRADDRTLAAFDDGGPDLPSADEAAAPTLAHVCQAVAGSQIPVVALLEGLVSGAGAELALAAAARLATPAARIAFPAARIGRITGAGGIHRLARLIGAADALRLLRAPRPTPAPEALALGLVDRVIEGDSETEILTAAAAFALGGAWRSVPDAGLRDGRAFLQAVATARSTATDGIGRALADCVEATLLLPADQSLAFEAAQAAARDAQPEVAALAHLTRAERAAAQTPEPLRRVQTAPVTRPGFAGGSAAVTGMVLSALARGHQVPIYEPERSKLVPLLQGIAARQEAAMQAGTLSAPQRDADWARLQPVSELSALDTADLVIVAADGPLPARKRGVPVLVMGRSPLPEGALRLVLSGRIAELGVPPSFPAGMAASAIAFLRRLGLTVVLTGVQSPAGISGRLAGAGGAALRALVGIGVAPQAVSWALTGFGLPAPTLPGPPDPAVPVRDMASDEILQRWLGALANEGARLLASGLAQSALDIDLVAVRGLGFPRESGGPLHQADCRGLMILRRDLAFWARDDPFWTPVAALDALVSVGRGFAGSLSRG